MDLKVLVSLPILFSMCQPGKLLCILKYPRHMSSLSRDPLQLLPLHCSPWLINSILFYKPFVLSLEASTATFTTYYNY